MHKQNRYTKYLRGALSCLLLAFTPTLMAATEGPFTYNYCPTHNQQKLDVFLPDQSQYSGPRPALLMFVGAGESRGDYHASLQRWADSGYVAAIASFKQSIDTAFNLSDFVQALVDGRCATRFLKAHSSYSDYPTDTEAVPESLKVDVNKIAVAGHSLGSIVVQSLAFLPGNNVDDGEDTPWEQAATAMGIDLSNYQDDEAEYVGQHHFNNGPLQALDSTVHAAATIGSSSDLLALASDCGVVHSDFLTADKKNAQLPMPAGCGPYQDPQHLESIFNGGDIFNTSWQVMGANFTGEPLNSNEASPGSEAVVPGQTWIHADTRTLWEAISPVSYINPQNQGVPFFVAVGADDSSTEWRYNALLYSILRSKGNLTKGYRYQNQGHIWHTKGETQQRINNRHNRDDLIVTFLNTVFSDNYQPALYADPELAYAHAFSELTTCEDNAPADVCANLEGAPASDEFVSNWAAWYECQQFSTGTGNNAVIRECMQDILPYNELVIRSTGHNEPTRVYGDLMQRFSALSFDAKGNPVTADLEWELKTDPNDSYATPVGMPGDIDYSHTFSVGSTPELTVSTAANGGMSATQQFLVEAHPIAQDGSLAVRTSWLFDVLEWPDHLGLMDIYRNGNKVKTATQSRSWSFWSPSHDDLYKVCLTDTDVCSAEKGVE